MAKRRRWAATRREGPGEGTSADEAPGPDLDPGALARQLGGFEVATGAPHGPVEIVLALVLSVIAWPLMLLARAVRRLLAS